MQLIKGFNQPVNTRKTDPGLNRAKCSTADAGTAHAGLGKHRTPACTPPVPRDPGRMRIPGPRSLC